MRAFLLPQDLRTERVYYDGVDERGQLTGGTVELSTPLAPAIQGVIPAPVQVLALGGDPGNRVDINGEPADVVEIAQAYSAWLSTDASPPKLFVNAEPGALVTGEVREFCRTWPNQTEVTVPGLHFVQEDSPNEIGAALKEWLVAL